MYIALKSVLYEKSSTGKLVKVRSKQNQAGVLTAGFLKAFNALMPIVNLQGQVKDALFLKLICLWNSLLHPPPDFFRSTF